MIILAHQKLGRVPWYNGNTTLHVQNTMVTVLNQSTSSIKHVGAWETIVHKQYFVS